MTGIFLFLRSPHTTPYTVSSIIINGRSAADGIPVSAKLKRGLTAPVTAPTAGPAKRAVKNTPRCIGRNAEPGMLPVPLTIPIT